MTWEFQGHAVLLLLCVLLQVNVRIQRSMMAAFVIAEGIVYGTFIWNVVRSFQYAMK